MIIFNSSLLLVGFLFKRENSRSFSFRHFVKPHAYIYFLVLWVFSQTKTKYFFSSLSKEALFYFKFLFVCHLFAMTNLSDQIISVFLNKQELILKDSDISLSLIAQGVQCYTEEIRRRIQSLSPGLFQISFHKDSSLTIQVEPKVID